MSAALTRLYRTYMPPTARHAIMAHRRTKLWLDRGVVFIHVPKCAGSSLNDALYGRFMGHIPGHVIQQYSSVMLKGVPWFSVLRDPVSRAQSAWRFARAGQGTGDGVTAAIRDPQKYKIPAFDSFNSFVQDWLVAQTLTKCDPVFQTQTSYVCAPNGQVLVDHLGNTADMAKTTKWVSQTLGQEIDIGHTNFTKAEGVEVSAQSRKVLEQIYASDYDLINREFA